LRSNGTGCFVLTGDVRLTMNGYEIHCVGTSCSAAAVEGPDGVAGVVGGKISGPFTFGVREVNEVRGMTIDGPATGIQQGLRIEQNVITNFGVWGIQSNLDAFGANNEQLPYVRNNFVDGAEGAQPIYKTGIIVNGPSNHETEAALVTSNFVRNIVNGIWRFARKVDVLDNIVANATNVEIVVASGSGEVDGNVCDDPNTCLEPSAPWKMP